MADENMVVAIDNGMLKREGVLADAGVYLSPDDINPEHHTFFEQRTEFLVRMIAVEKPCDSEGEAELGVTLDFGNDGLPVWKVLQALGAAIQGSARMAREIARAHDLTDDQMEAAMIGDFEALAGTSAEPKGEVL